MTDKLPPNLLALFAPRPPLRWVAPPDHAPEARRTLPVSGLAEFLPALQQYKEEDEYKPTESWLQMRDRKKLEKVAAVERLKTEGPKDFKPHEDSNIRGDAFKTLIVARLSYEANEQDLEREFGRFGPIERIRIITDTHAHERPKKKKKPHRGYAFVVFEREKDMRAALDACDGIRIKDRRIKVDVERGRTVKGWVPRRFGGGLGGRGYTKALPARPMGGGGGPGGNFGGGFRGGFRGGFDGGRGRGGFRGGGGGFGGRGGFRGGGDFGSRGGDRGPNGYGAPRDAPSGPGRGFGGDRGDRGDRSFSGGGYDRGGGRSFDDRSGGGGGGGGGYRDGGRFGDRDRDGGRRTGSNMEPIRPRGEGGYRDRGDRGDRGDREDRDRGRDRDRDYDRPRDDDSRKRGYEGGGYEDPRKLRRY
ncbi:U1 small nuclear ribonucleoprotein of 70kDa MW N terminal-domain-containing protein [Colletotrichum godetiae]|uniref:U1 small nuclear ribonucleoprotein of 70kDa MW N terminal-domain-containing protein n=1 Tax=Colletotrichum godetiae TaxID=1209918 RepID=A0AAJ0AIE2_9PEZI|nr:U1 small nuclear ribonucleoprotein of 70kDa MW N terminal-domain-containing protein [Colletotrichum godetiae]KAK1674472.1 U1 small nuclear ribonucleoprotein of 70kDa MW N terminal-domain-containing protein [Colletotrichum godetiae]